MAIVEAGRRLIRKPGWAFRLLGLLSGRWAERRWKRLLSVCLLLWCIQAPVTASIVPASQADNGHNAAGSHHHASSPSLWEGSAEGIAYSETNHHLAGILVLLIGISELRQALGRPVFPWTRLLLPFSLMTAGIFLLIWSDHEAWPIGSLSLRQSLWGPDPEILQHKVYGVLALAVGCIELLRRLGPMRHSTWAMPLPFFAIVGGLMLFAHSHGVHPAADKIQLHHAVMGLLAITAGSSKLVSGWKKPLPRSEPSIPAAGIPGAFLEVTWAVLILLIGLQLLFYSE